MRTEPSQPLRVLVTRGAGFLGSHLCERRLDEGHDVLCADNFYTGTRANVARLFDNPRFELLRHDITFPLYVEEFTVLELAEAVRRITGSRRGESSVGTRRAGR